MIISFTGHRPDKLGGYELPNAAYIHACQQTEKILKEMAPDKCISGMAIGYDQYATHVCIKLGIPFIAAVPFIDQEKMWPEKSKRIYQKLLEGAESVIIVSEGSYSAAKMQIRNEWMVDNSDHVLACYDGTRGGTGNCVAYARKVGKPLTIIDPKGANEKVST